MTLLADVDQWWVFDPTMDCESYVRQALEQYRNTPTTCGRVRPGDRDFARLLYRQKIPLTALEGAFVLAATRRTQRDPTGPPLTPIFSLRYFQSIIDEILKTPVDPGDISYLWYKMQGKH